MRKVVQFEPGQRVRLLAETAGNWRDPRLNRIAKSGRLGTVNSIIGTALPPKERSYFVTFDVARRGLDPVYEEIRQDCLEAAV